MSDEPKIVGYGVKLAGYMVKFATENAALKFAQTHGDLVGMSVVRLVEPKDLAKWLDGKRSAP